MLPRLLKSLFARRPEREPSGDDHFLTRQRRIKAAHSKAPLATHADILYADLRLGDAPFMDLLRRTLRQTDIRVPAYKAFRRPLASYFLARYFLHARTLPGLWAECGVFQGSTTLLLCEAARAVDPGFDGSGLHLVDSFQGLSEPAAEDLFSLPGEEGAAPRGRVPGGEFSASLGAVRAALADFPGLAYHAGWIPGVLGELPEATWSFVHIDVDLYEPTLASLEYFCPRLCVGGVVVCDDYGSPMFPGAARAWERYCEAHDLRFVVLDTGQSVLIRAA